MKLVNRNGWKVYEDNSEQSYTLKRNDGILVEVSVNLHDSTYTVTTVDTVSALQDLRYHDTHYRRHCENIDRTLSLVEDINHFGLLTRKVA